MINPTITDLLREVPNFFVDPNGCWIWTKSLGGMGYARCMKGVNRGKLIHRLHWEALNGPIPDELELDHLCRVTACVNPGHLQPVTHRENMLRGEAPSSKNYRKTYCVRGHELAGDNLGTQKNVHGNQGRFCRKCRRASDRTRYHRALRPETEGEGE